MNPFDMFKNIGKLQAQMNEMQGKIDSLTETGYSCGDNVSVTLNGKFDMVDIKIKPEAFSPEDFDLIAPLIKAAHGDAVEKMRKALQEQALSLTNGLNIPGFGN